MQGKGQLILTGQLGDVMKESARAAHSYIRSRAAEFGIDPKFYEKYDLHVHVPSGSVPKDGPSAGVTLFTALVSLLNEKKVKDEVAMTGEITLRGTVLPVGGIKEKVLAAHRAGIRTILLPRKNAVDLEEIPEKVKKELTFHFLKKMSDVLPIAIGKIEPWQGPEEEEKESASEDTES